MKGPQEVIEAAAHYVRTKWSATFLTENGEDTLWPRSYTVGAPTTDELERAYTDTYRPIIEAWEAWERGNAADSGLTVRRARRKVGRMRQPLPTHLDVDSIDAAALLAGDSWPGTIARARIRHQTLREMALDGRIALRCWRRSPR